MLIKCQQQTWTKSDLSLKRRNARQQLAANSCYIGLFGWLHSRTENSKITPHQKVEDAEAEHRERDADVSVVVEEVEHSDAQAAHPSPTSHNAIRRNDDEMEKCPPSRGQTWKWATHSTIASSRSPLPLSTTLNSTKYEVNNFIIYASPIRRIHQSLASALSAAHI